MSVRGGILIGGQSRRMGSAKHLLEHAGVTFAERLVLALQPHVSSVTFLGTGRLPTSLSHLEQLEDTRDVLGPLSGIVAALRSCMDPWLIVACDLPALTSHSIKWLVEQRKTDFDILMPSDSKGVVQPHFSFFEPKAKTLVEEAVKKGRYAPKLLAQHPRCACPSLPPSVESELVNMNAPYDLHTLEGID